jgi:hypothetical protein
VGEALMTISWKQLAAIPDSTMKQRIIKALDVEVPPEGIAKDFRENGLLISVVEGGFTLLDIKHHDPVLARTCTPYATAREVVIACRWPDGTPTGNAIREWLGHYGYTRPGKKASAVPAAVVATGFGPECHEGLDATDPNYQTRVIL